MLYSYGLRLGIESLIRGRISRETIKNLIVPVNYWRTNEYRLTFDALEATSADTILDIGSPKLLSLYYAHVIGARVVSTDIEDYFIRHYEQLREMKQLVPDRFRTMAVDGRKLPFETSAFSKVYSISVLEHIPGQGDSECMREIARVLMPGGRCVLTVPFAGVSRDEYKSAKDFYWSGSSNDGTDGKVFFQRRYSENDLLDRLVNPSGLKVHSIKYLGEKVLSGSKRELAEFLPPITGPIQPILSHLFHTTPNPSWRALQKPLGALLVLDKPV